MDDDQKCKKCGVVIDENALRRDLGAALSHLGQSLYEGHNWRIDPYVMDRGRCIDEAKGVYELDFTCCRCWTPADVHKITVRRYT